MAPSERLVSDKDQELETSFAESRGLPVFLADVSQQVYVMARRVSDAWSWQRAANGAVISMAQQASPTVTDLAPG